MKNLKGQMFFCVLVLLLGVSVLMSTPTEKYLSGDRATQESGALYLKNNIHAQQGRTDCKASYSGWTDPGAGHFILPVNTPVRMGEMTGLKRRIHGGRGFLIVVLDPDVPESRREIFFEFNVSNMGGMSQDEYFALITSSEMVSLGNLSEIDRKGISEGKAYEGMTKDGVRMALGYPAKHRTPSLDSNTWIYWRNRFRTMAVEFSSDGKVTLIRY